MPESIEESHIITQINGEIHEFSIIPKTRDILIDPGIFLYHKAAVFIEFYEKLYQKHTKAAEYNEMYPLSSSTGQALDPIFNASFGEFNPREIQFYHKSYQNHTNNNNFYMTKKTLLAPYFTT